MLTRRHAIATLASTGLGLARGARAGGPTLRIGGTGMALAAMRQVGDRFQALHPGAAVQVLPSLGTGGGLSAVGAGAIDLALLARPLNEAERLRGLSDARYAVTPLAFVTRADTAAMGVALPEVARILKGDVVAWPDGSPLRLVRREPSDADWSLLRRLSPAMAEAVEVAMRRPGLLTVGTDQENAEGLQRMRGSFGALSLGQLLAEELNLKPLALDGVEPTVENLAAGRYAMARTLCVAWRGEPPPATAEFLAFLQGAESRAVFRRLGHAVPAAS